MYYNMNAAFVNVKLIIFSIINKPYFNPFLVPGGFNKSTPLDGPKYIKKYILAV
jgi:hypothetical protein